MTGSGFSHSPTSAESRLAVGWAVTGVAGLAAAVGIRILSEACRTGRVARSAASSGTVAFLIAGAAAVVVFAWLRTGGHRARLRLLASAGVSGVLLTLIAATVLFVRASSPRVSESTAVDLLDVAGWIADLATGLLLGGAAGAGLGRLFWEERLSPAESAPRTPLFPPIAGSVLFLAVVFAFLESAAGTLRGASLVPRSGAAGVRARFFAPDMIVLAAGAALALTWTLPVSRWGARTSLVGRWVPAASPGGGVRNPVSLVRWILIALFLGFLVARYDLSGAVLRTASPGGRGHGDLGDLALVLTAVFSIVAITGFVAGSLRTSPSARVPVARDVGLGMGLIFAVLAVAYARFEVGGLPRILSLSGTRIPSSSRLGGAMGVQYIGVLVLTASVFAWWSLDWVLARGSNRGSRRV